MSLQGCALRRSVRVSRSASPSLRCPCDAEPTAIPARASLAASARRDFRSHLKSASAGTAQKQNARRRELQRLSRHLSAAAMLRGILSNASRLQRGASVQALDSMGTRTGRTFLRSHVHGRTSHSDGEIQKRVRSGSCEYLRVVGTVAISKTRVPVLRS